VTFLAADQTLPIPDIRKTLQVLSCKVYGGDSWTRTNVRILNRRDSPLAVVGGFPPSMNASGENFSEKTP